MEAKAPQAWKPVFQPRPQCGKYQSKEDEAHSVRSVYHYASPSLPALRNPRILSQLLDPYHLAILTQGSPVRPYLTVYVELEPPGPAQHRRGHLGHLGSEVLHRTGSDIFTQV